MSSREVPWVPLGPFLPSVVALTLRTSWGGYLTASGGCVRSIRDVGACCDEGFLVTPDGEGGKQCMLRGASGASSGPGRAVSFLAGEPAGGAVLVRGDDAWLGRELLSAAVLPPSMFSRPAAGTMAFRRVTGEGALGGYVRAARGRPVSCAACAPRPRPWLLRWMCGAPRGPRRTERFAVEVAAGSEVRICSIQGTALSLARGLEPRGLERRVADALGVALSSVGSAGELPLFAFDGEVTPDVPPEAEALFQLSPRGDGIYSIFAHGGRVLVCAVPGPTRPADRGTKADAAGLGVCPAHLFNGPGAGPDDVLLPYPDALWRLELQPCGTRFALKSYRRFGGRFRYLSAGPCGAARLVATAVGPWETFALRCPSLERALGRLSPRRPGSLQALCVEALADGVGDLRAAWHAACAASRDVQDGAPADPASVTAQIALAHALAVPGPAATARASAGGGSSRADPSLRCHGGATFDPPVVERGPDSAFFFPPHLLADLEAVLQARWHALHGDPLHAREAWPSLPDAASTTGEVRKVAPSHAVCACCARQRVPMNARVNKDHYLYALERARRASAEAAAAADHPDIELNLRHGNGVRIARLLFEVAFFALNNPMRAPGRSAAASAAPAVAAAADADAGDPADETRSTSGVHVHFVREWTRPLELNRPRRGRPSTLRPRATAAAASAGSFHLEREDERAWAGPSPGDVGAREGRDEGQWTFRIYPRGTPAPGSA